MGRRDKESNHKGRKLAFTAGLAALGAYLFDPEQGRTRRAKLQDQVAALVRKGAREVGRKTEYTRGQVEGFRHLGRSDSAPDNDPTLTAKVESEVLSRWNYPKGQISVNSHDGIVELRGTCDSQDQINDLEYEVRKVTGVMDVHNYLHIPGTPAPNKEEVRSRR